MTEDRVGTSAENIRERDVKNRRTPHLRRGQAHWSAKLSDADARRIRAARKLGLDAKDLAVLFGVSGSSIYNVWAGIHYAGGSGVIDGAVHQPHANVE